MPAIHPNDRQYKNLINLIMSGYKGRTTTAGNLALQVTFDYGVSLDRHYYADRLAEMAHNNKARQESFDPETYTIL